MKTLSKLNINSENLMKNEELTCIRGGYGSWECTLYYDDEVLTTITWEGDNPTQAANACTEWHQESEMFGAHNWCDCGC